MSLYKSNRRLSTIYRFCTVPKIRSESVAEHSYYTAYYTMLIADRIEGIDKEKAIRMALLHDVEEVKSGDVPHTTKEEYPEFDESLEKMNATIINDVLENDEKYINIWKEQRNGSSEESKIVMLADVISVLIYSKEEKNMGNQYMEEVYDKILKRLKYFVSKNEKYKFIEELFD